MKFEICLTESYLFKSNKGLINLPDYKFTTRIIIYIKLAGSVVYIHFGKKPVLK